MGASVLNPRRVRYDKVIVALNESLNATNLSGSAAALTTNTKGNIGVATGKTLTVGSDNTSTSYGGGVSGLGTFTKVGTGVLTLNPLAGEFTNTGGVNINAGTIRYGTGAAGLATGSTVTIAGGATLDMNNIGDTFGPLAGSGTVLKGTTGATLTVTVATGGASTFAGTITGGGTFAKAGVGSQTLTAANAYTGLTNVAAGTLATTGVGTLGTGNVTVADVANTTLSIGNANSIADTATLTFGNNSLIALAGLSGTTEILASIVDSTVASAKTLALSGIYSAADLNTYFGVTSFSSANGETVTIAAVPEPTTLAALAGVATLGLVRRRRHA